MDDKELKRGYRNGWILTGILLILIVLWTWFTIATNTPEVAPVWVQGGRPFVPGESNYGMGYETPTPKPQE